MIHKAICFSLTALFLQTAMGQPVSIQTAAARFLPEVKWLPKSVVTADFTCQGRKQSAILGIGASEAIVAIFLKGVNQRPEVLRYTRSLTSVVLQLEDLDYEPDFPLRGFRTNRTCKVLNVSDGEIDSAHIYWNHLSHRFEAWSH